MRSLVLILLVGAAFAAQATTCPCKDQAGKGFGFLECETDQSGFCVVDKGVITSWCKTPPPEAGRTAKALAQWITGELEAVYREAGSLQLLESGVYVTGAATAAVPRSLEVVRELDAQAATARLRFADTDPAGIEEYQKWRLNELRAPAAADACRRACVQEACSRTRQGVERDACLNRCNLSCGGR